jgi:hypothetical protein
MRHILIAAAAVVVLIVGAAASSGALQTAQPGQMTPARVWVQNRGDGEAVPVAVREVHLDKPLTVHVSNGEPGSGDGVQTRTARQSWDYETAEIPAGKDAAALLNARGALGWEAIGTLNVAADKTTILLKRPR